MFPNETRVLVILPQELVDRARVVAGRATTSMKLPVSLQIILRALIEEGLKRSDDRAFLANVANQATVVRRIRIEARQRAHRRAPAPGPRSRRRTDRGSTLRSRRGLA